MTLFARPVRDRAALVAIFAACTLAGCQSSRPRPPEPAAPTAAVPSRFGPIQPAGNGRLRWQRLELHPAKQQLAFPAVVNAVDVPLEYLLVNMNGKAHESLLVTDTEPELLHAAALLLAGPAAGPNDWPDLSIPPPGLTIRIDIAWRRWGRRHTRTAAELILDRRTQAPLPPGPWTYTGSRFAEDSFAAQRDGSIIALMTDPDALINNPRPGRDDDEHWRAHRRLLPPMGSRVRVTLTFPARGP